jgi:hypothetical protein
MRTATVLIFFVVLVGVGYGCHRKGYSEGYSHTVQKLDPINGAEYAL